MTAEFTPPIREDLVHGLHSSPAIKAAGKLLDDAAGVIVATPVYKAAFSGVLKAFLDLLGQNVLQGKPVLPIAVGGSLAHLLAIDYSLKPVLGTLGATQVLGTIYAVDGQIRVAADGAAELDPEIALRLSHAVRQLAELLRPAQPAPSLGFARSVTRSRARDALPSMGG